jgi:hypothetical protein
LLAEDNGIANNSAHAIAANIDPLTLIMLCLQITLVQDRCLQSEIRGMPSYN